MHLHEVLSDNLEEQGLRANYQENEQVRPPLSATEMTAFVSPATDVSARHLTPLTPVGQVKVVTVDVPVAAVRHAPAIVKLALEVVPGAAPTPEAVMVAHSLATPSASPTAEPARAASRAPRNWGSATADRMPTIATTIISSTRVKPFCRGFFFCRSFFSSSSCRRLWRKVDCMAQQARTFIASSRLDRSPTPRILSMS